MYSLTCESLSYVYMQLEYLLEFVSERIFVFAAASCLCVSFRDDGTEDVSCVYDEGVHGVCCGYGGIGAGKLCDGIWFTRRTIGGRFMKQTSRALARFGR